MGKPLPILCHTNYNCGFIVMILIKVKKLPAFPKPDCTSSKIKKQQVISLTLILSAP
jgi:hypothetical protein